MMTIGMRTIPRFSGTPLKEVPATAALAPQSQVTSTQPPTAPARRAGRHSSLGQLMLWIGVLASTTAFAKDYLSYRKLASALGVVSTSIGEMNSTPSPVTLTQTMVKANALVADHHSLFPNSDFKAWFNEARAEEGFQKAANSFYARRVNAQGKWTGSTETKVIFKEFMQEVMHKPLVNSYCSEAQFGDWLEKSDEIFDQVAHFQGSTPFPLDIWLAPTLGVAFFIAAFGKSKANDKLQKGFDTLVRQLQKIPAPSYANGLIFTP